MMVGIGYPIMRMSSGGGRNAFQRDQTLLRAARSTRRGDQWVIEVEESKSNGANRWSAGR